MSSYNINLMKAVAINLFAVWQIIKISGMGIGVYEYIVFESTISKYSLFIFYGFLSVIADNLFLRKSWNELSVTRYVSKMQWTHTLHKSIIKQQLFTTIAAVIALTLNCLMFNISVVLTLEIFVCFTLLFTYLLLLNLIMALVMELSQRPAIAFGFAITVNTACLTLGHRLVDINAHKVCIELITLIASLVVLMFNCYFMNTRDIYINRNIAYAFEK